MVDARVAKAAKILVDYSTKIKKGETVQIVTDPGARPLSLEVYKLVVQKGAYPILKVSMPGAGFIYYKYASEQQLKHFPKVAWYEMQNTDAVIFIGAPTNTKELAGIDGKRISMRQKTAHKIQEYRSSKTKWVIYYYPTPALAQEAGMSLADFEDFVYNSTNIDWARESKKQEKLKKIIDKGKQVRIVGEETDITFSIKGMKGVKCDGKYNMPDGEVFTTPIKGTVEGKVYFNYPSLHRGKMVEGIRLEFKKGKVVKFSAEKNQDALKAALETDSGSKYLGEFGIGVNYSIKRYIHNTLFDEKIGGTIHLALGAAYKNYGGKNKSAIHWDLVKSMKKGGKFYVDGKLIQKNGKFLFKF